MCVNAFANSVCSFVARGPGVSAIGGAGGGEGEGAGTGCEETVPGIVLMWILTMCWMEESRGGLRFWWGLFTPTRRAIVHR